MTLVEARKGGARGAAVEEATITPNSDPVNPVNPENSKTGLPFTFFKFQPRQVLSQARPWAPARDYSSLGYYAVGAFCTGLVPMSPTTLCKLV